MTDSDDSRRTRDRASDGAYQEEYPLDDILAIFQDQPDQHEPLTSREIANELDADRKTAYNKLQTLTEQGKLRSKKVGGRARVYWLSSDS